MREAKIMIRSNYHTHSIYCDGKSTIEEVIQSAVQKKLKHIGISSHAPIPNEEHWTMKKEKLTEYLEEVRELKKSYADQIEVFLGLEADYFYDGGFAPIVKEYWKEFDYTIGSVHALGKIDEKSYWYVDESYEKLKKGIEHSFKGDARKAVETYYGILGEMTKTEIDIVGHMDIIKKNNQSSRIFQEKDEWYRQAVIGFLEEVKKNDKIIEVNTGGVKRYGKDCFYPSEWILRQIAEKEIKITYNGDSHHFEDVDFYYEEAEKILKNNGLDHIWILSEKGWKKTGFDF
ncbi:MAG TPA: histidinol phosphatase [Eubacteriaceae bacterium]|nr:histidinol phosphatase [Eubacteriaceae bacterium]